jgi:cob(I)alamin adenosyltransferase
MTDERPFSDPQLAINRVYTRHGDDGGTRLVGGQRVSKDDARIEAYGTIDELNAFVGVARESLREASARGGDESPARAGIDALCASLFRVQHELFNLGSLLATLPADLHERQPRITQAEVDLLEREIDRYHDDAAPPHPRLPPLRSFVLPGGSAANAHLHVCRTVCRRAERLLVAFARQNEVDPLAIAYVNRLSDALFVWSRAASALLGADEVLWRPNEAASARR